MSVPSYFVPILQLRKRLSQALDEHPGGIFFNMTDDDDFAVTARRHLILHSFFASHLEMVGMKGMQLGQIQIKALDNDNKDRTSRPVRVFFWAAFESQEDFEANDEQYTAGDVYHQTIDLTLRDVRNFVKEILNAAGSSAFTNAECEPISMKG